MARDVIDQTPLTSLNTLVETLEKGCKPRTSFRIGTEYESFCFDKRTLQPLPYAGSQGIGILLEKLQAALGWKRVEDKGALIGLVGPPGQGAISIEPGGQLELSGAPLETLHQSVEEVQNYFSHLHAIADPLQIGFLGMGMAPTWSHEDMPQMPKSRYAIMTAYMPKVGTHGLDMMYRTASIQVNLDFETEADMVRKMRVALAIQPVISAMFANSSLTEGIPNGFSSMRAYIWQHTDPQRTGFLPFAFDEEFGFDSYVRWALDVPMYFVKRNGFYYDATHVTFRAFMDGALRKEIPEGQATLGDWFNHLSTLFPEVRLKQFLEMRGADAVPPPLLHAVPAIWTGLLYNSAILDSLWEEIKEWSAEERHFLQEQAPCAGLSTVFRGAPLSVHARRFVQMASEGLRQRGYQNAQGTDESALLLPLEEGLVEGGALYQTSASVELGLLEKNDEKKRKSIAKLFLKNAY